MKRFQIPNLYFLVSTALALLFLLPSFARSDTLLNNGDFEKADPRDNAKPLGWDRVDGLGVQWTQAPDAAHGKAIRMDTRPSEQAMQAQWIKTGLTNLWNIPKPERNAIAETYGLSLYSDSMPVKPGQAYRITFDFKGADAGAKVWVRGWGMFQGEKRRRWEVAVVCHSKGEGWTTISQVFHPTKHRPEVTEMRVMLFAFYPAGVYWFDNVRIQPVAE
ncbi:MAG: hypothetical protein ABSG59_15265 [Verrucomicrobiota bacterium]|jgi:hypothetical protein